MVKKRSPAAAPTQPAGRIRWALLLKAGIGTLLGGALTVSALSRGSVYGLIFGGLILLGSALYLIAELPKAPGRNRSRRTAEVRRRSQ